MEKEKWVLCPIRNNKTRIKVRPDTVLENFPLFCPECKRETIISVTGQKVVVSSSSTKGGRRMKKRMLARIPYAIAFAVDFYLFPLLIKDTGTAMLMLLFVIPLLVFACGVVYGVCQGFDFWLAFIAAVLFAPTIFVFYNASAWVYIIAYAIIVLAGNGVGRMFYKKR